MISIAMSVDADVEGLLQILNENKAYSYLLKPIKAEVLLSVLRKAFDHYNLLQKAQQFSENEQKLYQNIMETFDWKNEIFSKHVTSIAEEIIHQLNISFSQGEGIGTLLASLSVFFSSSSLNQEKNTYLMPADIYKMIKLNYDSASKMVQSISNAQNILMERDEYEESGTISDFIQLMEKVIAELKEAISYRGQKILLGDLPLHIANKFIILNQGKMGTVIRELLINAMKYSARDKNIYIMYFLKENYFEIKILNPANENSDGTVGISGERERLIFEPFFRMSSYLDERFFQVEEFSYGLGLTVVKKIIDLHKSNIFIYTVRNLSIPERENDVCVTLRFPIIN
jgi:signal transduction histidine kinase